jgi:hypothetical protein
VNSTLDRRAPSSLSSPATEREVDDVAAVDPRVVIVGLDDVAEQQRRASVCGAERHGLVKTLLALPGEQGEQHDHR